MREGSAILDNISLTLNAGEFITLVGPNGAGKTMLLRCLLRVMPADSGRVHHKAGLRVGYVPERIIGENVMPMSVHRFLHLNQKMSHDECDAIMDETQISPLRERTLSTLSGGEVQRVLLARALARNPDVLMLDEPAQNLDINGQLHFYRLIDNIFEQRKLAILMVSHDLHLVMASTHKVVCLYHHICCSGEPSQLRHDPSFAALFGDDMARLVSVYSHNHTHDHHEL